MPLTLLADHLLERRDAVLAAWRALVVADPALTTADRLTRRQFADHIPSALDALDRALRASDRTAFAPNGDSATAHGAHRWQQGYALEEVVCELGHLHLCLLREIGAYARAQGTAPDDVAHAHEVVALLLHDAVRASVGRYHELQRSEAAGRVNALETAVARFGFGERARGDALRAASHDLRGGLSIVSMSAALLHVKGVSDEQREAGLQRLQRGLVSLSSMLGDLADLSRLEAGQEQCVVARVDVAGLLTDLCHASRALASDKGLELVTEGPASLAVDADAGHLRRLAQNLILNAIRYTPAGRVEVRWEQHAGAAWRFSVIDTGPGLPAGTRASPLLQELKATTAAAQATDAGTPAPHEATSNAEPAADDDEARAPALKGEGIGLAIVKRLCELLDAGLEIDSAPGSGTVFRVTLPTHYAPHEPGVKCGTAGGPATA